MTSVYGSVAIMLASMGVTYALILLLYPVLRRHVLASPTHRSSHTAPTPQGGGLGLVAAWAVTSLTAAAVAWTYGTPTLEGSFVSAVIGTISLAAVGFADDLRGLRPSTRLASQLIFASLVVATMPPDLKFLPTPTLWVERAVIVVGLVWLINVWNFMDGLDWMTVAQTLPLAVAIGIVGLFGAIPAYALVASAALIGALIGFAPWNRPVARLFLGDAGSLAIGLLVGWLLLLLAGSGFAAAALLLPLYYLVDATATLFKRVAARERLWEAHRMHFYQVATDNGFTVVGIVGRVFGVNVALSVLALLTVVLPDLWLQAAALTVGVLLVGSLLMAFSKQQT